MAHEKEANILLADASVSTQPNITYCFVAHRPN